MTLINTGLSLPGVKAEFFERFNNTPALWPDVTTRIVSTTAKESYGFMGSVPTMRPWGTGRVARGLFTEKYDVENERYEASLEVDRNEISDDQTGQIRIRISELAERAQLHKDSEISGLLANGHSSGFNSYDGVPFFSATHESGKSGVQDNDITSGATAPTTPTVAEIRTALKSAIATLLSLKDDQGEPMNNDATGLMVIVPPATYLDFLEALNASIVASTSNVLQSAARVVSFARISAATVFYLLKTNVSVRPFIFQDREPIEFTALEQGSESGFMREKYIYGVRARYKVTYGYWQRAVKVTFV